MLGATPISNDLELRLKKKKKDATIVKEKKVFGSAV